MAVQKLDVKQEQRERCGSSEEALKEQPQAFVADDVVGQAFIYRVVKALTYQIACWFHDFELEGLENLPPPGTGALLISIHTTHCVDIPMILTGLHEKTGRVPRGLMHRVLFQLCPFLRYLGLVPGKRNTGKHLLQQGFLTCVLPGGAEEGLCGHESAYTTHVRWADRRGYVHVAKDAGVDIIPVFTQNVEEMRFNPLVFFANKLGLTRKYQGLVDMRIPALSWCLKQLSMMIWGMTALLCVPVPVKVTLFCGAPVRVRAEDSVDDIADRARRGLDDLIAKHQPHGHAYLPGLRLRYAGLRSQIKQAYLPAVRSHLARLRERFARIKVA